MGKYDDFDTAPLWNFADAVAADLENVKASPSTGLFDITTATSDFVVDFGHLRYKELEADAWEKIALPSWTVDEARDHVFDHLRSAAFDLGDNVAMRRVLLEGGIRSLDRLKARLENQGKGRLSAMTIDEIMKSVAHQTLAEYQEEILKSPWAFHILQDAWRRLMSLGMKFLHDTAYSMRLAQERLLRPLRIGGWLIMASIASAGAL